ncbi:MAG TPA: hypothetical protein VF859_08605 [Burkholderiales bacterium]
MNGYPPRLMVAGSYRLKLVLMVLFLLAGGAAAQSARASDALVWHCWFDARTLYVICEPQRALPPVQLAAGEEFVLPPLVNSEPTEAVPASLAERGVARAPSSLWRFPLYTEPTDMNEVQRLARILMCRRQPDCQVVLADLR